MKVKIIYVILFSILTVGGIYFLGYTNGHKKGESASTGLLEDTMGYYSTVINGLELRVTEKDQEVVTLREALRAEVLTREELRKLNIKQVREITRLLLQIDTLIDIAHGGEVVVFHDTITQMPKNALLLPFEFAKKDNWLSIQGKIDENGKMSFEESMKASLDIWSTIDKKTKQPTVKITTDNPYLDIIGVKSFTFEQKPKKWSLGVQAGYGITKNGLSPFVGVGVTRSLIRF